MIDKIKSKIDADSFFWWIADHDEFHQIQGHPLTRLDDGRVSRFGCHIFDIDWIWSERKMINDWIDMINVRLQSDDWHVVWTQHGKQFVYIPGGQQ